MLLEKEGWVGWDGMGWDKIVGFIQEKLALQNY